MPVADWRITRSPLRAGVLLLAGLLGLTASAAPPARVPSDLVLWAWERPEDLSFAGPGITVGVLAGTVTLSGAEVFATPRLQPARIDPSQRIVGVVHVEIDRTRPLPWTGAQRGAAAARVLALLANPRFAEAQIDFEVRASHRAVLLDLLHDVRVGLPPDKRLSMTALASWCDTETWLSDAAADEIVPMLFRMGSTGESLRQRLAAGGDFRLARCRSAIGIATDTPPSGLPPRRRLWLFNPRAWMPADLAAMQARLQT